VARFRPGKLAYVVFGIPKERTERVRHQSMEIDGAREFARTDLYRWKTERRP